MMLRVNPADRSTSLAWYYRNRENILSRKRNDPDKTAKSRKYQPRNLERHREVKLAWYYRNRGKVLGQKRNDPDKTMKSRVSHLKHFYGLSLEQYTKRCQEQAGLCLICQKSDPLGNLSVDHDHVTGEIRGLLCRKCNALLGQASDSIPLLAAAIDYLRR